MIKTKAKKRVITRIIKRFGIKTKNYWKNILQTIPQHQVGVIKASGKVIEGNNLEQLALELSYLCKETGFFLPLVIDSNIKFEKLESFEKSSKIDGLNTVSEKMIDEIKKITEEDAFDIVNALEKYGVSAKVIPVEEIRVTPLGEKVSSKGKKIDFGYMGDVISIDTKPIIEAIYDKKIPIISNIGIYKNEYYLCDATDLATELVKFLQAKKLIILGEKPLMNKEGALIKAIYSEIEFIRLIRNGTIKKGMIRSGNEAYDLLNYLGPGHSVQITSLKFSNNEDETLLSTGLLEELLGNGSGTILLMPHIVTGYPIKKMDKKFLGIIREKINQSFKDQKKFLVDEYFKDVMKKDATLYLDPKHKGGAITYPIEGAEYMCKLFTDKDFEGLGLGTSIIEHIYLQKGALAWRTSVKNKQAIKMYDGIINHYLKNEKPAFMTKRSKYKIYGINVKEEHIKEVINYVENVKKTFEEE